MRFKVWCDTIKARFLLLASGPVLILSGCDPAIQTTVETGIISLSTSLLSSFLRAAIELSAEAGA